LGDFVVREESVTIWSTCGGAVAHWHAAGEVIGQTRFDFAAEQRSEYCRVDRRTAVASFKSFYAGTVNHYWYCCCRNLSHRFSI